MECEDLNTIKITSDISTSLLRDLYLTGDSVLLNQTCEDKISTKDDGSEVNRVEWETIELPDMKTNESFISENILLCATSDQDLLKMFEKQEEKSKTSFTSIHSCIEVGEHVATSPPQVMPKKDKEPLDKCDILEKALNNQFYIQIKAENGEVRFISESKQILPSHNISPEHGNIENMSLEEEVESLTRVELVPSLNKKMPRLHLQSICIWLCPHNECRLAFLRFSPAKNHTMLHFNCKPFKCDHPGCNWAFFTSFKLKRHKDTHFKKKNFTCQHENCGRQFTTIYNLAYHKKLHDRPAKFKCSVPDCNALFQTVRARELHLKTHGTSEAPYRCQFKSCNKSFFLSSALLSHAKVHSHKESELRCQWPNCGRIFEQPCRLKEHIRQHTGFRPYICTYDKCKWAFTTSSKLKRHLSTHTNDRKFQCTIGSCTKAFLRSEHLKEHTLTHIGQRNGNDMVASAVNKQPEFSGNTTFTINFSDSPDCHNSNTLLEQAVQSLEVPSDVILGTGILPEETSIEELLPHESFEKFSTVNLKDLRNLD